MHACADKGHGATLRMLVLELGASASVSSSDGRTLCTPRRLQGKRPWCDCC